MTTAQIYRIDLQDLFSGPLDLLLYLVRKHELDILDISLTEIVTEFQEYLEVLEIIDFDIAADFVVTASTLAEIKSRLALVQTSEEEQEQEEELESDSANEGLVLQLLEYKRLKDAAELLQEQALAWQDRYPRLADERPDTKRSPADDYIKDVEVWDLVGAFARIVRKKKADGIHKLRFDTTPVHVYVEQIGKQVREQGEVLFQSLFDKTEDRSVVIGMFLAVLELLRHHQFRAVQLVDYGDIWIKPPREEKAETPNTMDETGSENESDDPAEQTND